MDYPFFGHNAQMLPIDQAAISVNNIEYSYGFGVYESMRVTNGIPYFLNEHVDRLFHSASIIGLQHAFSAKDILDLVRELIHKNSATNCNIKVLLIGGKDSQLAELFILCLHPFYPDKKLYRDGAHFISYDYERVFPQAKTLNMLPSYLAYRQAKQAEAYDALLVNRNLFVTEGTRTNLLGIKGKTLISAPEDAILLGVMRKIVLNLAKKLSYTVVYQNFTLQDMRNFDGAFVTSTSSKLLPVKSVNEFFFTEIPESLQVLKRELDIFLGESRGVLG